MASGDFEIKGASEFGALARRLKAAGEKDLTRELFKGVNAAIKPMRKEIRSHVGDYVPAAYAPVLARSLTLAVGKRTNKTSPGVNIRARAKGKTSLRKVGVIDSGVLEHPLFGMRKHWYPKSIKPGFFTEQAKKDAPRVREEIHTAMETVAQKIASKGE